MKWHIDMVWGFINILVNCSNVGDRLFVITFAKFQLLAIKVSDKKWIRSHTEKVTKIWSVDGSLSLAPLVNYLAGQWTGLSNPSQLYYLNSLWRCFDISHSSWVCSWCHKSNNVQTSSTELSLPSAPIVNFFLHFCHPYDDSILLRRSVNKASWNMFRISFFFIKQIKLVFT